MRERLTVAFVVLSVVLLLGAGAIRTYVLRDLIREQAAGELSEQAGLVAVIIEDRADSGRPVDEELLAALVGDHDRLQYDDGDGAVLVATGPDYDGSGAASDGLSASAPADGGGTVTISQSRQVTREILTRDIGSLAALFLLIAVVAGLVGFVVASWLSAPSQRLAAAAAALGRGRFDLDLPDSRVPEAQAITNALRSSAQQLEERLHRERDFAEHASHVLRTPLTGMRLELEDLQLRDDVAADVRKTAARALSGVEAVDSVVGELVDLARHGSLVTGAELPLTELSTQLAQRWADRLAAAGRTFSAAVEGDLDLALTPGPVEHVTDLLLADVIRRTTGAVRLVLHGEPGGHLRIHVECEARTDVAEQAGQVDRITKVRGVVESLGGRVAGTHPADGLDVLLPRR